MKTLKFQVRNSRIQLNWHVLRTFTHKIDLSAYEKEYLRMDYYSILGCNIESSSMDIKKNYYKLAKTFHPDLYKGSSQIIKKVNEAYRVLINDTLREKYDSKLKIKTIFSHRKEKMKMHRMRRETHDDSENSQENQMDSNELKSKFEKDFDKLDKNYMLNKFFGSQIKSDIGEVKIFKSTIEKKMTKREFMMKELMEEVQMAQAKKKQVALNLINTLLEEAVKLNPTVKENLKESEKQASKDYKTLLAESSFTTESKASEQKRESQEKNKEELTFKRLKFFLVIITVGYFSMLAFMHGPRYFGRKKAERIYEELMNKEDEMKFKNLY